jgi:hypothetical protein
VAEKYFIKRDKGLVGRPEHTMCLEATSGEDWNFYQIQQAYNKNHVRNFYAKAVKVAVRLYAEQHELQVVEGYNFIDGSLHYALDFRGIKKMHIKYESMYSHPYDTYARIIEGLQVKMDRKKKKRISRILGKIMDGLSKFNIKVCATTGGAYITFWRKGLTIDTVFSFATAEDEGAIYSSHYIEAVKEAYKRDRQCSNMKIVEKYIIVCKEKLRRIGLKVETGLCRDRGDQKVEFILKRDDRSERLFVGARYILDNKLDAAVSRTITVSKGLLDPTATDATIVDFRRSLYKGPGS